MDVCSKYAWSIPLHDKTDRGIVEALEAIHKKPRFRGGEFYNKTMDRWLKKIVFTGIRPTIKSKVKRGW